MFLFIAFVLCIVNVFAIQSDMVFNQEIIDYVNNMKTSWTAGRNERFEGVTKEQARKLLGAYLPTDPNYYQPSSIKTESSVDLSAIPAEFDARNYWPKCANIIGRIRDQSYCGSCWAFGSTESFNDRYCIKTGDNSTVFSPEDTNSCSTTGGSAGCGGGYVTGAWKWFTTNGVTSGLDYPQVGEGNSCKPYSIPDETTEAYKNQTATGKEFATPKCATKCSEAGYPVTYAIDKHFASSEYGLKGVSAMQSDILEYGPIAATFTVYADFYSYTDGVYHHVTGANEGGHAIKIIGWGTENGVDYWLINNSWNIYWGIEGVFKIRRGTDECGIENGGAAGVV